MTFPADTETVRESLFSVVEITTRLDELRLTEDVIELRREVHALVEVAKAAHAVFADPGAAFPWGDLEAALARFDWPVAE